jgi:hypothetical protein
MMVPGTPLGTNTGACVVVAGGSAVTPGTPGVGVGVGEARVVCCKMGEQDGTWQQASSGLVTNAQPGGRLYV